VGAHLEDFNGGGLQPLAVPADTPPAGPASVQSRSGGGDDDSPPSTASLWAARVGRRGDTL
jgi:hypothetical protein